MTTDRNGAKYHGLISRQGLISLCQSELPRLRKENEELADSVDLFERQHGDHLHTIHSLNEGLAENIGFQKALRMVCEWAKNHLVENPPVGDVEDEIAELKQKLKERFEGKDNNRNRVSDDFEKNLFAECDNLEEIIGQIIGAGSMAWVGGTGSLLFDSEKAVRIHKDAISQIHKIIGEIEFIEETEIDQEI